jgi:hypothetical protein
MNFIVPQDTKEPNIRLTETIFGWGRETVAVGLAEKRTGLICYGAQSALSGNKRWEDRHPDMAEALHQGVDPTVVSPTAISITANQGSVYIEVEPTLPSRKCQEDIYDLARYASRNENSDFILTLPGGSF